MENKLDYPGFPSKVPEAIKVIIYGDVPKEEGEYKWKLVEPHSLTKYQYTYKDLEAAYTAGVDREYDCNGCGYGGFEKWFKDEFSAEKDERNDSK